MHPGIDGASSGRQGLQRLTRARHSALVLLTSSRPAPVAPRGASWTPRATPAA